MQYLEFVLNKLFIVSYKRTCRAIIVILKILCMEMEH